MALNSLAGVPAVRYRRMRPLPWFLIVSLCALPLSVVAQNKTAQPEGEIALSQIKKAMGGARWDDVRTLHAQGEIQLGELHGNYDAWLDLRHLYSYTESRFSHLYLGELRFAEGWNGSISWSADQTGYVCVASSHAALRDAASSAYTEAFGYLLKNGSTASLQVKPDATFQRQSFHVLLIEPQNGLPFELWTDPATARFARVVPLKGVDQNAMNYGDLRPLEGLLLPFRIEEREAHSGKAAYVRTINSIEINRDPPGHRFEPPRSVLSRLQFPPGSDSVSLPFRYDHGHLNLPVSINGRSFENFVFDTGMNNTLNAATAKSLRLKVVKAGAADGAGTGAAENGMAKVERLEIGSLKWRAKSSMWCSSMRLVCRSREESVTSCRSVRCYD